MLEGSSTSPYTLNAGSLPWLLLLLLLLLPPPLPPVPAVAAAANRDLRARMTIKHTCPHAHTRTHEQAQQQISCTQNTAHATRPPPSRALTLRRCRAPSGTRPHR